MQVPSSIIRSVETAFLISDGFPVIVKSIVSDLFSRVLEHIQSTSLVVQGILDDVEIVSLTIVLRCSIIITHVLGS